MGTKRKGLKREIIEWSIMLSILGVLYFTGLHTEVVGSIQSLIVKTGIIQPSLKNEHVAASYDLWLEDMEGQRVSLESMRGKTIFMNIWATWCPPCIAEMPDIHQLYQEVKGDVVFVMISRDRNEQKARDWIANREYEFPVYFLRSQFPSIYQTQAIPTTFVISPEGLVTVQNSGMAKYNTSDFREYLRSL